MDFASYLGQVERQAAALRAAAVSAGPTAPVPTCPEWTVRSLVRHVARVHSWAVHCLHGDPAAEGIRPDRPPEVWDDLLPWWDDQLGVLLAELRVAAPDAPAWVPDPRVQPVAGFWARRQAHETAIHRLDAEHANAGSGAPAAVPSLVFGPDLAADGIDEALTIMVPRQLAREESHNVTGTVLFHAADAGRAWLVRLRPGKGPEVGPAEDIAADASVVGTADAVYRAAWHRPSTAVIGGDHALIEALRTP